ncbi:MAG: murein biosynthesis integral membrane protein MurJ [Anaerolineaceae bacterium]|nr:murein biosynthesis integral membrane protein MurJ [Anaerolineaceae bacterium]
MSNQTTENRNRQIARSTLVVMAAFAIAKVISLAQTIIIARVFGVGREWDTFVTANSLPELIFTLISGGALAHAFIPIFSGYLARDDKDGAWKLTSHVINTVFATTAVVSIIVFFTAPWWVANVVAPGFDAAAQQQTADLMRILLISTLIFSVSGISMGILQSHNHFLLPAIAPIMFDLGILFGAGFLIKPFGVRGIAYGAVLGAALHFAVQVPGLIHFRARWTAEMGWKDPMLWKVLRLMLPRVAGLGLFSLNFLLMNNIASRLGEGSVSALSWGWRLMQIPETLIGTAMGTVIFPTLAALSDRGDESGKRAAMSGALRFILIATIPSAVGLILIGQPVITLLEGGAFDASASVLVYSTLRFFALGLVVHSALEVVARSFYADKDTLTPLWAAAGGAIINFVLAYALSNVASVEHNNYLHRMLIAQFPNFAYMGTIGTIGNIGTLALANSAGVAFEVLSLLWILRRRWHGANESLLAQTFLKATAASLVMGLIIVIVSTIWHGIGLGNRGTIFTVIEVAVMVAAGGLAFLITAYLLKMHELQMLVNMVLRRKTLTEAVA